MAALLLFVAPLRAIGGGCDLCPPDCPMHAAHRGAADTQQHGKGAPRLHCHNAPATADPATRAPRISRPPCGAHAVFGGLDLAPMLPARPLPWRVAPPTTTAPSWYAGLGSRGADPPDTPPPDATA